nr:zinc finger, CCHC-type [Tanacetum cinerariifolium]
MIEKGGKNKNNKQNKGKKCGFKDNNGGSDSNKKPKLECWKCGKTGHFKRDCRSGNKKNNASASGSGRGSKDLSQDQDRCWFKTYEPMEDGHVLYMGDDHFAHVHGKGSVVLEFISGKSITLFNVLCVPKLRKNLISSPVLNKCGYKQVYESDKFYVIEPNDSVSINSIIESRDVIFDKNRFSSIPRPKDIIPNLDESQRDDHSDDVPSEIPKTRKVLRRILEPIMKLCNLVMPLSDQNQVDKTKKFLSLMFWMKDMGEVDVIIGIKIKRKNKGIVITQSHYIEKILKKFNREDCSPVSTPMDPVEKLKPNTGKPMDQLEYSRAIGCLMYVMTSTRPDIAYAVGRLSRFTSNPSRQH